MTDYHVDILNGRCPYTDEPCTVKISCIRCQTNEKEKALMEAMDEMEKFEMLLAELQEESEKKNER